MKKILLLIACLSFLFSCNQETAQKDDMLTIEDTTQEAFDNSEESNLSYVGNGTEPFWGFNASGSTVVLREPSDTGPIATTTFTGVTISSSGTSVNMSSTEMNLDLVLETCSDGMSDLVYEYSSSFTAGSLSYTGCANAE